MEHAALGRSGLVCSVVGLGGGGPSRFGLSTGSTEADAIALIRRAYELGVTLFDGGGLMGGVDRVLGKAVKPFRREILLSTKVNLAPVFWPFDRHRALHRAAARAAQAMSLTASAHSVRAHVERTLRQLDTDYIDLLNLHAVTPGQYPKAIETAAPALADLQKMGFVRATGITEAFSRDPGHRMLERAIEGGFPDVVMTGFNVLNRSARSRVFPLARRREIGVLAMFAVSRALRSEPDLAQALRRRLPMAGPAEAARCAAAFIRVLRDCGVESLTDAAYRFCRHEQGVDVVLVGTGSRAHLERNIAAVLAPPLPEPVLAAVETLFGPSQA
jgi:aryl-alcohol dehydrogenase-like predicted oxidoreductase